MLFDFAHPRINNSLASFKMAALSICFCAFFHIFVCFLFNFAHFFALKHFYTKIFIRLDILYSFFLIFICLFIYLYNYILCLV